MGAGGGGGPQSRFTNLENLHFGMITHNLKFMRKLVTCIIWVCKSSCTGCVFCILQEVGAKEKLVH